MAAGSLLHGLQHAARIDHHGVVGRIDRTHLAHAAQVDDHGLGQVRARNRAFAEAGVAALGHHRHLRGMAELDHLCDLRRRRRKHNALGLALVAPAPVGHMAGQVLLAAENCAIAKQRDEGLNQCHMPTGPKSGGEDSMMANS